MEIYSSRAIDFGTGFIVVILVLLFLEKKFPLRTKHRFLFSRLFINAFLSLISFAIVFFLIFPAQNYAVDFSTNNKFGLLRLFQFPEVVGSIIGFVLMDLAFYYWHLLNHKIQILWRFHNVHHLDPYLDVSTAFRFHFGEIGFSTLFRILQLSLIGINPGAFMIYELCFTASTIFQHSNIKLPIKLERVLNKIIVTPRMHGIHHSYFMEETNSNYSTVFSWWDRLHKTLRLNIPQSKITIGVPAYSSPEDNSLLNVLLFPFRKQRQYWKISNKLFIQREEEFSLNKTTMLYE